MHQAYWGLRGNPFDNDNDLRGYYAGEAQEEALLRLRYTIEQRKGAAVLLGDTGLGKTYLVRVLAAGLDSTQHRFITLRFPQLNAQELLAYLAVELGADPLSVETPRVGLDRTVREIERQVEYLARQDVAPVVVVDEAHLIDSVAVFHSLRLLLNIQPMGTSPLTLLFLGQPELAAQIARVAPLADRVATQSVLRPFTAEEVAGYVQRRLEGAGGERPLFTDDALKSLHVLSGGTPRRINRLCDLALLLGFADESAQVSATQIETAASEFQTTARARAA